jgi:hypothetical protein
MVLSLFQSVNRLKLLSCIAELSNFSFYSVIPLVKSKCHNSHQIANKIYIQVHEAFYQVILLKNG